MLKKDHHSNRGSELGKIYEPPSTCYGAVKMYVLPLFIFFKDLFHAETEPVSCGYIGKMQLADELRRERSLIILIVWEYKYQTLHFMWGKEKENTFLNISE